MNQNIFYKITLISSNDQIQMQEANDDLKRVYFFRFSFNKRLQRLAGVRGFTLK